MVCSFPQINIRICLKKKDIPECLIDIIVNDYNNTYYIHKVLEESRKYHIRRCIYYKKNSNLKLQIELFISGFLKFYNKTDFEHNGDYFPVITTVPVAHQNKKEFNNFKIRTANILMNWVKSNNDINKISDNDGNLYICAGRSPGHWFNTIQEQHHNLVSSLVSFNIVTDNYNIFGHDGGGIGEEPLNPCVKCILYEKKIINISIKIH